MGGVKKGEGVVCAVTEKKGDASDSRQCEGENTLPPIIKRKVKDGKRVLPLGVLAGRVKLLVK